MVRYRRHVAELDGKQEVFTSEALTRGVRVKVVSRYSPEHSHPEQNRWFFLYTVEIANHQVEEVRGPGVVGQQPVLGPGESFEYTSGCPLTTPFGSMRGTYQMVTQDGGRFDATIAPFTLSEPYTVH